LVETRYVQDAHVVTGREGSKRPEHRQIDGALQLTSIIG
jgi:hypothetical protein